MLAQDNSLLLLGQTATPRCSNNSGRKQEEKEQKITTEAKQQNSALVETWEQSEKEEERGERRRHSARSCCGAPTDPSARAAPVVVDLLLSKSQAPPAPFWRDRDRHNMFRGRLLAMQPHSFHIRRMSDFHNGGVYADISGNLALSSFFLSLSPRPRARSAGASVCPAGRRVPRGH